MKTTRFKNPDMAWEIAATLYFPPDFDETRSYPTVISIHPFGSCKEQTSGAVYGQRLAKLGYVVIAYDATFQGESGGQPRWVESPTQRVEDVSHVIDYAVTLDFVNDQRIAVLGVCGGGGYAVSAASTEKRIKAVIAITPVNLGRLFRESFSRHNPLGALEAMAQQRTHEARGEVLEVNELLPSSPDAARDAGLADRDVLEATEYYKTERGRSEGGATRMLFSHAQQILSWDAFAFAETLLTQPVLVVVGEKVGGFGAYRDGTSIHGRALASTDRRIVSLPDWSHYDLYDQDEPVEMAMDAIRPFLGDHLS